MLKLFKCDKLCTVSDREVKCERCGEKTKFLCDCEDTDERDLIVKNLQKFKNKIKQ